MTISAYTKGFLTFNPFSFGRIEASIINIMIIPPIKSMRIKIEIQEAPEIELDICIINPPIKRIAILVLIGLEAFLLQTRIVDKIVAVIIFIFLSLN